MTTLILDLPLFSTMFDRSIINFKYESQTSMANINANVNGGLQSISLSDLWLVKQTATDSFIHLI